MIPQESPIEDYPYSEIEEYNTMNDYRFARKTRSDHMASSGCSRNINCLSYFPETDCSQSTKRIRQFCLRHHRAIFSPVRWSNFNALRKWFYSGNFFHHCHGCLRLIVLACTVCGAAYLGTVKLRWR